VKSVPGVTLKMLVKLGENDIKTVDDLAGCATDDLVGWTERKESGEQTKHAGILDGTEITRGRRGGDDHAGPRSRPAGSPRRTSPSSRPRKSRPLKNKRLKRACLTGIDPDFALRTRVNEQGDAARMLALADPELDKRTADRKVRDRCGCARSAARWRPIDELIRFRRRALGRGDRRSEAQTPRPGTMGFGVAPGGCGSGTASPI